MANIQLLLVENDKRFLNSTKIFLEKRSVTTYTATNSLEAIKILDKQRIDVVILDVMMTSHDGIEVFHKTKQKHPLVEVIIVTGHESVESAVEGLKLGAFDYILKPCDITDLMKKVNRAFRKKQATEEKIRKVKVERIISHPMAVFEEEKE
jgi:DNA-binding NtrC family response regulator